MTKPWLWIRGGEHSDLHCSGEGKPKMCLNGDGQDVRGGPSTIMLAFPTK